MKYNKRRFVQKYAIILAVSALILFFLIQNGLSYVWWSCDGDRVTWDSHPDDLRASEVSFPEGSRFRSALGDVVDLLNASPSSFTLDLRYDERIVSRIGTQSEIWFSNDFDDHSGYAALTWLHFTCNRIYAADIVFNNNEVWSSGTYKNNFDAYGGSAGSFRAVLMHELGHTIGLLHEADEYNLMGRPREHVHTNCSLASAYLGEDAADGAVYLYGADASAEEDVGVVHWKWARSVDFGGLGYDFSDHTRTRIHPVSSPIISWYDEGEPTYLLQNGDTIDVEFTFENNGATRQRHVRVGYYLSDNGCITTWDLRLGGFTADLGRNQVWTTTRQITLPDDLEGSRYYYIGAIVDETDELDEFNEANNATYVVTFLINPVPVDE